MRTKILAVMITALILVQAFVLNVVLAEVNDPRIPLVTPTPVGTQTTPITIDEGGGGGKIIVEGYFYFIQSESPWVPQPIRGAEVEVYDDDGILGRQKMGSGLTDDNGHFRITGLVNPIDLTEWSRPDIYVEVHASNWVTEIHDNPLWWGGSVYRFRTHVSNDVWDGDLVNFGTCTCPMDQNRVWDIFQTMQAGYWFMVDQTGKTPPKIKSFYNDILQGETAFYQGVGMGDQHGILAHIPDFIMDLYSIEALYYAASGIHFKSGSDSHRTVLHEYGHYVMDLYMDISPPFSVAPHFYESNYNDEHGLAEGWAHFFSAVVRWWWGAPVSEYRDDNPVERNYLGSGCEGAIAGILWDIFDSPAINGGTDDDSLTMSFQTIWNVMTGYDPDQSEQWPLGKDHPWTIWDFWEGFKRSNPGAPVSQAVAILGNHNVIFPDNESPVNPNVIESTPVVGVRSSLNKVTVKISGAYDLYEGQQVNVKEYMLVFANYHFEIDTYLVGSPDWFFMVGKDVGGSCTWTSIDGLPDDEYYLNVRAIDSAGNFAADTVHFGPFILVDMGPIVTAQIENTLPFDPSIILHNDTYVSLGVVANTGFTTTHFEITNSDETSITGDQVYSGPFAFDDFQLTDGFYILRYYGVDDNGTSTETTRTVTIDSTPPTTEVEINEPKTAITTKVGTITHITKSSTISLMSDDHGGTGTKETLFRINNAAYDLGWQTYSEPIKLTELSDGAYWLEYYSIDIAGNIESSKTEVIVLDNNGPSIRILLEDETIIQDRVTITSSAFDIGSGIDSVNYTISHLSRVGPVPVNGFIDLSATKLPNSIFSLQVDLSSLANGEYLITAEGVDVLGNTAQVTRQYRVYEVGTTNLIPKLENAKAERTVPVKFTLTTNPLVDPTPSFIYNEDLRIEISRQGTIIQTSLFGVTSTNYRIDPIAELYIVNFKTASTPTTYQVSIFRGTRLIGSFTFSTKR